MMIDHDILYSQTRDLTTREEFLRAIADYCEHMQDMERCDQDDGITD
jgi:hypothetical protein